MSPKRAAASIGAASLAAIALFLLIGQDPRHGASAGNPSQVSAKEHPRHRLAGVSAYLATKRRADADSPAARKSARERHRTGLRIGVATGRWLTFIYDAAVGHSSKRRSIGLQTRMAKSAHEKLSLARDSAIALNLAAVAAAISAANEGLETIIRRLSAGRRITKKAALKQNALMDEAIKQARAAGLSATPFVPL